MCNKPDRIAPAELELLAAISDELLSLPKLIPLAPCKKSDEYQLMASFRDNLGLSPRSVPFQP